MAGCPAAAPLRGWVPGTAARPAPAGALAAAPAPLPPAPAAAAGAAHWRGTPPLAGVLPMMSRVGSPRCHRHWLLLLGRQSMRLPLLLLAALRLTPTPVPVPLLLLGLAARALASPLVPAFAVLQGSCVLAPPSCLRCTVVWAVAVSWAGWRLAGWTAAGLAAAAAVQRWVGARRRWLPAAARMVDARCPPPAAAAATLVAVLSTGTPRGWAAWPHPAGTAARRRQSRGCCRWAAGPAAEAAPAAPPARPAARRTCRCWTRPSPAAVHTAGRHTLPPGGGVLAVRCWRGAGVWWVLRVHLWVPPRGRGRWPGGQRTAGALWK
jgi:hypothetical protein